MSFSFSVPTGAFADFTDNANAAKQAYVDGLGENDYALNQISSGIADEAIKAAQGVLDSGVLGTDGTVGASLSGHAGDNGSASTLSLGLTVAPAPVSAPTNETTPSGETVTAPAPEGTPATEPSAPSDPAPTQADDDSSDEVSGA
jgi:hypothetical protein